MRARPKTAPRVASSPSRPGARQVKKPPEKERDQEMSIWLVLARIFAGVLFLAGCVWVWNAIGNEAGGMGLLLGVIIIFALVVLRVLKTAMGDYHKPR
jgi:hypothetical protein